MRSAVPSPESGFVSKAFANSVLESALRLAEEEPPKMDKPPLSEKPSAEEKQAAEIAAEVAETAAKINSIEEGLA